MSNRQTTEQLIAQLEAAGRRSTPQRHAICHALAEHGGHPTVAEIYERVRGIFPMISQATVYNTIDTLRDLGVIRPIDLSTDEHTHYDLDLAPHVNLVCRQCGTIADLPAATLDPLLAEVAARTGYAIDAGSGMVMYGVCPACSEGVEGV